MSAMLKKSGPWLVIAFIMQHALRGLIDSAADIMNHGPPFIFVALFVEAIEHVFPLLVLIMYSVKVMSAETFYFMLKFYVIVIFLLYFILVVISTIYTKSMDDIAGLYKHMGLYTFVYAFFANPLCYVILKQSKW